MCWLWKQEWKVSDFALRADGIGLGFETVIEQETKTSLLFWCVWCRVQVISRSACERLYLYVGRCRWYKAGPRKPRKHGSNCPRLSAWRIQSKCPAKSTSIYDTRKIQVWQKKQSHWQCFGQQTPLFDANLQISCWHYQVHSAMEHYTILLQAWQHFLSISHLAESVPNVLFDET